MGGVECRILPCSRETRLSIVPDLFQGEVCVFYVVTPLREFLVVPPDGRKSTAIQSY